jgi:uncharacterized membrane protein
MTQAQLLSLARAVLNVIGTALVMYGASTGITEELWTTITGSVLTLLGVGWGLYTHTTTSTIEAAAKLPEVAKIVVTPTLARDLPSPKVVDR